MIVNRQDDIEGHTNKEHQIIQKNKEHQGYREDFLDERDRVGTEAVDNDRRGK